MQLPRMCSVRRRFDSPVVEDVADAVRSSLLKLDLATRTRPGQTVAVTAGSRGIAAIPLILRTVCKVLRGHRLQPFLVPAMGSHGGGTVAGQTQVLAGLGITEESVGAPVRATMDTVIVAETDDGIPVHFDRFAHEADHVLVVNRVKPHTRFVGPIESGLHKMMLIGLGKHAGAAVYHRGILTHSFPQMIESVAGSVLSSCCILGGIAILENARDETALIEGVMPSEFAAREPELLRKAVSWLPTLPFPDVDLLIIDRIGKNISGVGMDANVVGRKFNDHAATDQDIARCRRIFVRGLTEETQGNGTGIGMAEFTTQRCVSQVDHEKTMINCITGLHPEAAMIPVTLPTDRLAVETALQTIGLITPENARVIQISDTLHLESVRVSEAYFPEVERREDLSFAEEPAPFPLDSDGWMTDIQLS